MSLKPIPTVDACKSAFRQSFALAFQDQSEEKMTQAVEQYAADVCEAMLLEARSMTEAQRGDAQAMAARGIRTLTSGENRYYSAVIQAMGASTAAVKSALEGLDVTMPETILDQVMEDVKSDFPLLDAVNFVNSSYMRSWIYNKQGVQTATWGEIGGAIKGELSGAFGKLSATQCKLTAFMVVSKDYLALGPAWLDRYIRAILVEACGYSMECAIVDGAGNADSAPCPIGMTRDLSSGSTGEDGLTTYPRKEAIAVTSLDPTAYGSIISKLVKTPTGRTRRVSEVLMVCNPVDYLTKVMPATTIQAPSGEYIRDRLPFPTKIIPSDGCPEGLAVVGIAKQYVALLGWGSKKGVLTYDDSVQFLEDNRVYAIKALANGRPKDNTVFVLLDISGLEPLTYKVTTVTES